VISFCSCNLGAKALYHKKPPEAALFRLSGDFDKKLRLIRLNSKNIQHLCRFYSHADFYKETQDDPLKTGVSDFYKKSSLRYPHIIHTESAENLSFSTLFPSGSIHSCDI
jgi:hypothetical protein